MRTRSAAASLALTLALAACGDNLTAAPDAAVATADAAPAVDAATVDAPAAWHLTQPMAQSLGGHVLAAPRVVPIFFTGDGAAQAQVEAFLAALAPSPYWPAISAEYGIGALTIAPSVVATEAPPTTDQALQAIIAAHAGGTGGWPANTANTIYAVYLPKGVTLTAGGSTSCQAFAGYHDEVRNAGVVYALMPWCETGTFTGIDQVTIATSHELIEAASDPHPQTDPAFASTDDGHLIWQLTPGAELGDLCETARAAYQPLVGSFMVQRTWSNASAAAGHDPCVPVLATPYVEAATNLPELTLHVGGQTLVTPGVVIAVGASKVVEVELYSDGDAADWTVEAIDVAAKYRKVAPELAFAFDKTTGHRGDKLQLTITRLKAGSQFGISELGLASKVNGVTVGTWFALVQ